MLRRANKNASALDLFKQATWNLVLYFVYFFTLLFWMRLITVNAQGNRGVIINNEKFDDSSGVHHVDINQLNTYTPPVLSFVSTKAPIYTSTQRPTTSDMRLVTINDFQPQHFKRFNSQAQAPSPNNQMKKQVKRPLNANNFLAIENILKRNHSDEHKINEMIHKLNETGNLSKVNIFDTLNSMRLVTTTTKAPRNITYVRPYESHDHQKDSKELKVQFVLDCDLKDSANTMNRPKPSTENPSSTVKMLPIQYPTQFGVFNQRIPTPAKYAYTPQNVQYYIPTKKSVKIAPTASTISTKKPRVKNVYVDPPVVAEISDTFENVYSYFESALTTKVKTRPKSQKITKKQPMKRSTAVNPITRTTSAPKYRYTQSYANNNGQKLTTNIHVTSEYLGKDPDVKPSTESESDSYGDDELDYDSEDYSDSDDNRDDTDDDDDDDDDFGFSLGSDDDYDEDSESDSDIYDGPPPNKINGPKSNCGNLR